MYSLIPTFLCSEAVLGLSGVVFMLAGVAATGDEEVFSIISAGIVLSEYPTKTTANYGPMEYRRKEYFHTHTKKKPPLPQGQQNES